MGVLIFLAITLGAIALLILLVTTSRTEVKPGCALVYNNIWTGNPRCVLPGTDFIIPGVHRVLEKEVSLKNEAQNPSNVPLITGDGIELEVDYIVRRMQVGFPGMPEFKKLSQVDREKLKSCAVLAVTEINYGDHRDKVLTRMVAHLQSFMEKRTYNELFEDADLEKGEPGKVNAQAKDDIETSVNEALKGDIATLQWGFWNEIDLEDYNLPETLRRAREQKASAKMRGQALKEKLTSAGLQNEEATAWAGKIAFGEAIGEAIGNALHGIFGKKKE